MMRQSITRYMAEKDAVYGEAFRLWRGGSTP